MITNGGKRTMNHNLLLKIGNSILAGLFLAILASSPLHGGAWIQQNSGTPDDLHAVHFTDISNGWAVGDGGTILRTTDGGNSWDPQDSGTTDDFKQVRFLNNWYGFAVGHQSWTGKLYTTSNGGEAWTSQDLPGLHANPILYFLDANNLWAVSWDTDGYYTNYVYIHRSTDGGSSWQQMHYETLMRSSLSYYPKGIDFYDYTHGYVLLGWGNYNLLSTHDGGANWSRVEPSLGGYDDIDCIGPYDVWFGGYSYHDGKFAHTLDGGSSWTSYDTRYLVRAIDFLSSNQGWAACQVGNTIQTTNGGASWLPVPSNTAEDLNDITFVDSTNGWAVGDNGAILRYYPQVNLYYGAQYVGQHYPLSMASGSRANAWIEYRNTGTIPWHVGITKLGTTEPRDRVSSFYHISWPRAKRPCIIDENVYPGETYKFGFTLQAPVVESQTTYTEHWGLVEEGVEWFGPPDDEVSFTITVNPSAPSGPNVPLAVMKDFSGDQNLFIYNAPEAGDYTLSQAAARNQPNAAYDFWRIPAGNRNPCIVALDIDGNGYDELAVLKKRGLDHNLFIYNAPLEGDKSYWDALARNPSPLARDLWFIPAGNDVLMMANAGDLDGVPGDELAVMKKQRSVDYNLYIYTSPAAGDWAFWDARARNPSPMARDLWITPFRNDAVAMAGMDTDGDYNDDHLLVLRETHGDQNLYMWNVPAVGDWTFLQAIARNPSPSARDLWGIPHGNSATLMTCANVIGGEDRDEIIIMKNRDGDHNLFVYNGLRPGDTKFWDSLARNPSPLARDLWIIPVDNNATGMTAPR